MPKIIQTLINIGQKSLFKVDKTLQQPLLNNNEILDLLMRVQSNKKAPPHKHDISFRKMGDARSVLRGHGMDYEESRQYQSGDDPRYMNWQLSARTGQHYMKVFREERQPGIFILVDRRHSMRFGTKQRLKITQAARAATIAAFTAQEKNFSIGGVILDEELEWFNENQNQQAVFDFIHRAARPALPAFNQDKIKEPDLEDVLRLLNQILTSGSKVYLISDFYDLKQESQSTLLQLSSLHEVHAIQITDKAETELPHAGDVSLKSVASNKHYNINSNSRFEQNKFKTAANDFFSDKQQLFKNIAIHYQQVFTTDENIERKINL